MYRLTWIHFAKIAGEVQIYRLVQRSPIFRCFPNTGRHRFTVPRFTSFMGIAFFLQTEEGKTLYQQKYYNLLYCEACFIVTV